MTMKSISTLFATFGILATSAEAAVIAQYGLNGNTNVSNADANLTATVTTDLGDGFSSLSPPEGSRWRSFSNATLTNSTDPTSSDVKFAFSLTPTIGNQITLDLTNSVTWAIGAYAGSGEAGYTVYSTLYIASDAAFTNILATSAKFDVTNNSEGTAISSTTPFIDANVSSSSTLYFGFALTDNTSSGTFANGRIDNLIVNGTVAAVPEPSAALLGGLGILALLRRRRES